MIKIKIYLLLIAALIILNSCDSDPMEQSNPALIEVEEEIICKDGILHFKNAEVFFNTIDRLTKDGADISDFEKQYGFNSMATYIDEIFDKFETISDESSYQQLIDDYSDYIKVNEEGDVVPAIDGYGYTTISNKEGKYYVGTTLYIVKPEYLCVNEFNPLTRSIEEKRFNYSTELRIPDETRAEKTDQYISREYYTPDRKLITDVKSIFYYSHTVNNGKNEYKGRYTIQFHSRAYKWTFKVIGGTKYHSYQTRLYFDNVVFNFKIPGYSSSYYNIMSRYFDKGDDASYISSKKVNNYYLSFNDDFEYKYEGYLQQPEIISFRFRSRSNGSGDCGINVNVGDLANWSYLRECK